MKISIATAFPELYDSFLDTSLIGRARQHGLIDCDTIRFSDVCKPKERIDEPTCGHGRGMIIRPEVIERVVERQEGRYGKALKIFFSPHGHTLDQPKVRALADHMQRSEHVMFFAGRYEGIDARAEQEYADHVLSIGDYVLMGGDLPTMVTLEAALRYLPGVVGQQSSVEQDSFSSWLVDYPEFCVPIEWKGHAVPEVLRSGNHAAIAEWREQQALARTVANHFEWVRSFQLDVHTKKQVAGQIPAHYTVLMHGQVMVQDGNQEGTTSVTSIDIHDIARSSATYGIEHFFLVTPLLDQQKIVERLLSFWHEGEGSTYNKNRKRALDKAALKPSLDAVITAIEKKEGVAPIVVATSAKEHEGITRVTYCDQHELWRHKRPVVLLFGTGQGLAPSVLSRCDYILGPIEGFSNFNHLSVRSAVAVVLDRLLGLQEKKRTLA